MNQYLFLVAIGRSGSTLVQALLNCLEDVSIKGENGFVIPAVSGLELAVSAKTSWTSTGRSATLEKLGISDPPTSKPNHPWYGVNLLDENKLKSDLKRIIDHDILQINDEKRVYGFKEIRWHEYRNVFKGMDLIFPNAKYVFNFRSAEDIAKSGWWPTKVKQSYIEEAQGWIREECIKLGDRAIELEYENYTADLGSLDILESFVGKRMDWRAARKVHQERLSH